MVQQDPEDPRGRADAIIADALALATFAVAPNALVIVTASGHRERGEREDPQPSGPGISVNWR